MTDFAKGALFTAASFVALAVLKQAYDEYTFFKSVKDYDHDIDITRFQVKQEDRTDDDLHG